MVRKVVVHADAAHVAAQLHAPPHPGERAERGNRLGRVDAGMAGGGDGRESVQPAMRTLQLPAHPTQHPALPCDFERAARIRGAGLPAGPHTEALDGCPTS